MAHILMAERHGGLEQAVAQMVDRHSNALAQRPWLIGLNPDCHEPAGWPQRRPWVPVLCAALADRAYRMLRGELPNPCHGEAQQWRAKRSRALRSAIKRGYRRIGCGDTVNAFLREPPPTKRRRAVR
jgi:hypothetical protein